MVWADVVADLTATLAQLTITSPVAVAIAHVYPEPPATVQVFPAFVVCLPDSIEVDRSDGLRTETNAVRCRYLALEGGDAATTAKIADAFRQASVAAFDAKVNGHGGVTLGGTGILNAQTVDVIEFGAYAGKPVVMFETTLTIRHDTLVNLS